MPRPKPKPPKSFLDIAWPWCLRFLGVAIIVWETVAEQADRPALLVLAAGLALGPEFVKLDRKRGNGA